MAIIQFYHELLFQTRDWEKNCTRPGLLFHHHRMLVYLLTNCCTVLAVVNRPRSIIYKVVL